MKFRKVFCGRLGNRMVRYRYMGRRMFLLSLVSGSYTLRVEHPSHTHKPERYLRKRWKSLGKNIMENERSANLEQE